MNLSTMHARRHVSAGASLLLLLVFVLRSLIPTGFMVDTRVDADPLAVTLCSGHGPVAVSALLLAGTRRPDATGVSIDRTAGVSALAHRAAPNDPGHGGDAPAHGICPFNAALALAVVSAAIPLILCYLLTRPIRCRAPEAVPVSRLVWPSRHARAPPALLPA
ncbi:hypothetical protein LIG30_3678 [Burkholderia sp. lig30]|jgi:hypothetical protein|uniref:hypothetical protein n=1 Tax=Burkholderia sp. lig30 TaxID=1192124 RepID=UPI00046160E1|nr:hypothetical protein [Burkholderia sp. lig30]KDB07089.1 hypothetical protein LIG30_3678 [Burkholderia sp. lig30]